MSTVVLLASHNRHKLEEVRQILGARGIRVESLDDWPAVPEAPEDADNFVDNAVQKARFVSERTGRLCVADDSGLEVDALGGAPGVRSKRFTPEATAASNNARLLDELAGRDDRGARFRCAIALVTPDGRVATAAGACEGRILRAPRGEGGFGYDPLFEAEALPGRSLAQVTAAEKNAISHRGRAFAQLPSLLAELGVSVVESAQD
jgi:XTP/dITP diphosphohydrolase